MDPAISYLPHDRRHALAHGEALPERARGAALFADISGFTPLTEALVRALGARRGAEELTRQLNLVYDALIVEVDRYGGSVVGFSGDAITCWFNESLVPGPSSLASDLYSHPLDKGQGTKDKGLTSVLRAVACALRMHGAMAQFGAVALPSGGSVTLAMKAAVASGPVRRFVVGDPAIQRLDLLAGATLNRMIAAEHIAHRGEVVLSPECEPALGDSALVLEWRSDQRTSAAVRYPVVSGLMIGVPAAPWPPLRADVIAPEDLRPWLLPAVYAGLRGGQGELLTELRPAVALFLSFEGIDYDGDEAAGAKLDGYIRWVQQVLARYDGTLIQLTIDERGCYLYAAFGAPATHEDDARRAVMAALDLRATPAELAFLGPPRIGISRGVMRTGAYGSATRRTYGVLGDAVNLAARLMQAARPGETLVSAEVQQAVMAAFRWGALPALRVKGKREPIPIARLLGAQPVSTGAIGYTGALVGRAADLERLVRFVWPIFAGQFAGLAHVYGEAGIGKSRLIAELRRELAAAQPPLSPAWERSGEGSISWFTCPADALGRQSLHSFRLFLRAYFDQDAGRPEPENQARFDAIFDELLAFLNLNSNPWHNGQRTTDNGLIADLDQARFFLGALVDLHWAGSPYEQADPKLRFEATLAAFRTLIRAESLRRPLVVHIEDAHWLDDDSRGLVRLLTRDAVAYPFVVLLAGRYRDDGSSAGVQVEAATPQLMLHLSALSRDGIRALAAQTLGGPIADDLTAFLVEKTGGNPFFVEQLALDLRERGLLLAQNERETEVGALEGHRPSLISFVNQQRMREVPANINAVLIARLDRLAAPLKAIVQTAAVLGQEFDRRVLTQMLADDAELEAKMRRAEDEAIWSALSETRYRFRNTLLRDAAYDMQVHTRLRALHARAGAAIEQVYGEALAGHVADLVYHAALAEDAEREGRYLTLLGEQALNASAFREAIACFERALALADEAQRARLTGQLARTYRFVGDQERARQLYRQSLALAEQLGDWQGVAATSYELASLAAHRSEYAEALSYMQRSLELSRVAHDRAGERRALNGLGGLYIELGQEEQALACYEQALSLGRVNGGHRR